MQPRKRQVPPRPVAFEPVQRRPPRRGPRLLPAGRQPVLRARVAAVLHELEVLGVGGEARGQQEGLEKYPMPRRLIVESERAARVADLAGPFRERSPGERRRGVSFRAARRPVRRMERIAREDVLDVGEDQLLVLLLVVEAELDDGEQLRIGAGGQQSFHAEVDVAAITEHLLKPGPGQHAAALARELLADGVVVGIEEKRENRIKAAKPVLGLRQDEGLEEPARVGQVPARRAAVGHRLDRAVFGGKRRDQRLRGEAHGRVTLRCGMALRWSGRKRRADASAHRKRIGGPGVLGNPKRCGKHAD